MGGSSSKKAKEEQEKKEKEAKQKRLDTKALLEAKYKQYEALYNAKFKESKNLEDEARKKLKAGDKAGAKKMLVKKKKIQQRLDAINNQLVMMDDQIIALENAENLGTIMKTVKQANTVLKEDKVDVAEIQAESDKLKDLKDQQGEFNKVIEDFHNENVDEDELDEELEKCQKELEDEIKLPSANNENLNDKDKNKNKNLEKGLNKISV